jgi:diguanylate cyclase (GGDEF)-like protein/PAS domain S-box-containing protein
VDPGEIASVLDAIGDGVYVVDRERTIQLWNSGAAQMTGYDACEAVGRWCGDGMLNHVDEEGRSVCGSRCPLSATMRDGMPREVHVYLHHKDGSMLPVRVSSSVLRDDSGEITGAVEVFMDDSVRVQADRRASEADERATHDPLTGVGNREFLDRQLDERLAEVRAGGQAFGVLFLDVDRFKRINDTYGHAIGDEVLKVLGATLTRNQRAGDVVARYGGEEFVVVTGPIDREGLAAVANRLRIMVGESRVPSPRGVVQVKISIGTSRARCDDTAASLLERADQRMLAAKRAGRNCVIGCDQEVNCSPEAATGGADRCDHCSI